MKKVTVFFVGGLMAALLLTGCETPEPTKEQVRANHETTCKGYGFKPNTDTYANCLMEQDKLAVYEKNQMLLRIGQDLNTPKHTSCSSNGSRTDCFSY